MGPVDGKRNKSPASRKVYKRPRSGLMSDSVFQKAKRVLNQLRHFFGTLAQFGPGGARVAHSRHVLTLQHTRTVVLRANGWILRSTRRYYVGESTCS